MKTPCLWGFVEEFAGGEDGEKALEPKHIHTHTKEQDSLRLGSQV